MPDASELVKAMKRAALEAQESTKPVNVCFGTVESVSPLQINVEQKMVLGKNQLVLSRNVTEYKTMVTIDWETEQETQTHTHKVEGSDSETQSSKHKHKVKGKKEITVHNQLVKGDEVILIRQQGGQKYVVIDRIGVM